MRENARLFIVHNRKAAEPATTGPRLSGRREKGTPDMLQKIAPAALVFGTLLMASIPTAGLAQNHGRSQRGSGTTSRGWSGNNRGQSFSGGGRNYVPRGSGGGNRYSGGDSHAYGRRGYSQGPSYRGGYAVPRYYGTARISGILRQRRIFRGGALRVRSLWVCLRSRLRPGIWLLSRVFLRSGSGAGASRGVRRAGTISMAPGSRVPTVHPGSRSIRLPSRNIIPIRSSRSRTTHAESAIPAAAAELRAEPAPLQSVISRERGRKLTRVSRRVG